MKHIRVLSLLLVMLILASCTAESIAGGNVTAIGTGTEQTTKSDVQENGADFTKETEEKQEMTEKTTPEKEGLSSEGIAAMMDGLKKAQLAMHSVLIMRHGEIVAEGYAEPFDKDSLHRMYSVSKSFVGIAIGVLESEGKISINDTIDKYFPDYVTEKTDKRIAGTKIVDLLRMASPFRKGSTYKGNVDMDWTATFFTAPVGKEPGTEYLYDTSATHILGVIVERVTGMDFLEYLKQKALLKMGFSENSWCVKSPEGYAWGGSGVMCTTRDLALFAQLVMRKGEYNGEQLLPRAYTEAATQKQIDNSREGNTSYYGQGYGYQIWITEYGFAFLGMGDQLAICVPEKDLLFVCTADNQGNSTSRRTIFDLFETHILANAEDAPLPENSVGVEKMEKALADMEIPHQLGLSSTDKADEINGVTFTCQDKNAKISSFCLDFLETGEGVFTYVTPRGEKQLRFGIRRNVMGVLDEPQYSGEAINHPAGRGYRSLCSAAWETPTILVIKVQVIDDYFGNMTLTFDFSSGVKLTGKKTAEWFLDEYVMNAVSYKR